MKQENYIPWLERVVFALLQRYDDHEEVHANKVNPDNSPGYFIPYAVKELIQREREQRGDVKLGPTMPTKPDESEKEKAVEKEIIECLFAGWVRSDDMPLYGGLSYQMVFDFMTKLGIDPKEGIDRVNALVEKDGMLIRLARAEK